jgi:hypothetical protein
LGNTDSEILTLEFIEQIQEGWKNAKDVCSAGMGNELVEKWYEAYGEAYSKAGG